MQLRDILEKGDKFGVEFDQGPHVYTNPKGEIVPGTTSAIGGMIRVGGIGDKGKPLTGLVFDGESESLIDRATMTRASERGTRIHEASEHFLKHRAGQANELDAVVGRLANGEERGAFEAVKNFWTNGEGKKFDTSDVLTEASLSSEKYGYAGTIDVVTKNKLTKNHAIVDYKFGKEVKHKAGLQLAANRNTLHEQGLEGEIERHILHVPEGKLKDGKYQHSVKLYNEKDNPNIFGSYEDDLSEFTHKLEEYIPIVKSGGHPDMDISIAKKYAKLNILDSTKRLPNWPYLHIGFGAGEKEEQKDIIDFYADAAREIGYEMTDFRKQTSKGKGLGYEFQKVKKATPEQEMARKETANVLAALRKKDQVPFPKMLEQEWNELKRFEIGGALDAVSGIGSKVGNDLLSILSRTDNFKYAGAAGAIGYVGGMAYGALHDTSDPTSTYHEDKHVFTNALKGAASAAVATYGVTAVMNARAAESRAGEMVAYVGNSARGLGGRLSKAVMGAWKATKNMR